MALKSILADQSGKSRVALNFAQSAMRAGNSILARQLLQDHLSQNPNDADALEKLAEIAQSDQLVEEATILLRRAVAADPSPPRRLALVDHLRRYVSPALALAELEQLPQQYRGEFDVKAVEAALAGSLGMNDRQIDVYRAMVRQRPSAAGVWVSLGNALKTVGRTTEAVAALQSALRAEPAFGEAYWTLANFKSYRFSDRDLSQMRSIVRRRLPPQDALHLHFALGKAYEDREHYEQSFDHYSAGNALRAAGFDAEQVGVTALVDESIATFTDEFFRRNSDGGCKDEGPIFVVGLHRSGSTLVEQILASHPMIEGTTELGIMKLIRDRIVRGSSGSGAAAIAA